MTDRGVPSRRTFLGQTLLGLGGLSGSAEAQPSIPAPPARALSVGLLEAEKPDVVFAQ